MHGCTICWPGGVGHNERARDILVRTCRLMHKSSPYIAIKGRTHYSVKRPSIWHVVDTSVCLLHSARRIPAWNELRFGIPRLMSLESSDRQRSRRSSPSGALCNSFRSRFVILTCPLWQGPARSCKLRDQPPPNLRMDGHNRCHSVLTFTFI
jgi:hypothetical protein